MIARRALARLCAVLAAAAVVAAAATASRRPAGVEPAARSWSSFLPQARPQVAVVPR